MYALRSTRQYRKSYNKLVHSGRFPKEEVDFVINELAAGRKLDIKYRDHALSGDLSEFRECHIKSDLLILYQVQNEELILVVVNIGSHSDLFR